jgi:hypothetical protein
MPRKTRDAPGEMLAIGLIRGDGATQPRARIDPALVGEYAADMRRGDEFPPVVVFFDGTDHWLADGFHRRDARRAAGHDDVAAPSCTASAPTPGTAGAAPTGTSAAPSSRSWTTPSGPSGRTGRSRGAAGSTTTPWRRCARRHLRKFRR